MSSYDVFSRYYDNLTKNIDYIKRAQYFDKLISMFGGKKNILLDLACGTGSLSEELSKLGYDVIGVDNSYEMLSTAMDKKIESGLNIQYLCQDMTKLDMFGTVDVTICALDSLNHLDSIESISEVLSRVKLFSEPGGLFIFDINTPYKHKRILGNNTFVYDTEKVYCVWQNTFVGGNDNKISINLDFFDRTDKIHYVRKSEEFCEIAPEIEVWKSMIAKAGFKLLSIYDYDSFENYKENSEKVVVIVRA
jgi:2-polyprenyl-3-methyl-5-hydroxy-6-metoxy-1,4-benzoquinol methylase